MAASFLNSTAMKLIRNLILPLVAVILMASSLEPDKGQWVIDPSSTLTIHGTTNLNRFSCGITCYANTDTLEYSLKDATCDLVFSKNEMVVPIHTFDCGSEMITKDFQEALQARRYPDLQIRFLSLSNFQRASAGQTISGILMISLAGKSKRYSVTYNLEQVSQSKVTLRGTQPVCFSDFNLEAPKKMMGLIRVNEDLEVEFRLLLRPL